MINQQAVLFFLEENKDFIKWLESIGATDIEVIIEDWSDDTLRWSHNGKRIEVSGLSGNDSTGGLYTSITDVL